MPDAPIRYLDRATGQLRTERVYGDRWLRFAYGNPAGRLGVWLLFRRAFFSRWYGWRMNKRASALRVLPFIADFDIDVDDFDKSAFDFRTFNEFFHRGLKPGARPIAPGGGTAVFPADGRHLVFPDAAAAEGIYVKGQRLPVAELLDDPALAGRFEGCGMLISRLCPSDYHRFHFPVDGVPGEARPVGGWLYSVNPVALRRNLRYLVENRRMITVIESPTWGATAMIEIGATNVGSIRQGFIPGQPVRKGDEKGFFAFGGSCVITLFAPGRMRFDADLVEQSARQVETYARMGGRLGGVLPG
jgi:phosphatidylserine decarboxylase